MENRIKYKSFYGRMLLITFLLVIQVVLLLLALLRFNQYMDYIWAFFFTLSIIEVFVIVNKDTNPAFKLALVIPILIFPIFGGLFYLIFSRKNLKKDQLKKLAQIQSDLKPFLVQDDNVSSKVRSLDESVAAQMQYIHRTSQFPVYENTTAEYLSPGEIFFQRLKEKLRTAEKFILMEYFIIQEGFMWNEVLEILVNKAQAGVDVRVIYDDLGTVRLLPNHYDKHLVSLGLKCHVFNPFSPIISATVNNRDHRKITVIDGRIAFTGGLNLADEYINKYNKIGHWKDAAVMLEGEAVRSFTVMFLSLWSILGPEKPDFKASTAFFHEPAGFPPSDGFIVPYGDIPTDHETVGENVYLNLINKAKKYIYICTPYFVVDNETMTSLCLAAKSGVDVRIVTPHIPDKWYIHTITKAHYQPLIENGVRVYEYTPGFMHSKTIVCDHHIGIVGSINFDFRSLYLHFECAVLMYRSGAVHQMDKDFEEILKVSQEVTLEQCRKDKPYVRIARMVLKLFSPLM